MSKIFNINGVCYPGKHYMVNLDSRLKKIKELIDSGDYFVINRARQYGKTTLLRALKEYLQPEYIVISMSFQKFSTAKFRDEYVFSQSFAHDFLKKAEEEQYHPYLLSDSLNHLNIMRKEENTSMKALSGL